MNTRVGTSGFQYPEWKGKFYPAELPVSQMLGYYAERFATTEVNYTFRQLPSAKTITRWREGTPEGFVFSCKAPQRVTHFARLVECEPRMEAFAAAIAALGEKLGPVLFQLPPNFSAKVDRLDSFLRALPQGLRAAFEFRHESWLAEPTYEVLRAHGAALCLAESEELSTTPEATADFGYLRLRREDYRPADLRRWARLVQRQLEEETWREAFIYFKHEETGVGAEFAEQFSKLLAGGKRGRKASA